MKEFVDAQKALLVQEERRKQEELEEFAEIDRVSDMIMNQDNGGLRPLNQI